MDILSSFCETEGSFSNSLTHKRFLSPRFEFKVYDKNLKESCLKLFKSLGFDNIYTNYNIKKREHQLGVYRFNDFIRLCFLLHPYLNESNKKRVILIMSTKDLITRVRIKSKRISLLIKSTLNRFKLKKDFINEIKKNSILYYNSQYANDWKNGDLAVPLNVIIFSCNLLKKNIFDF